MPIRPEHLVNLQGKQFVLFPGLLNLAHESGLTSIQTELIQIPTAENGHSAIVKAIARFDSEAVTRCWTAFGDASPANTKGPIQHALLRMAETRAIGRVLRMACNVGETLLDELGGDEEAAPARGPNAGAAPPNRTAAPAAPAAAPGVAAPAVCVIEGCGVILNKNQVTMSQHKCKLNLCPEHVRKMEAGESA